MNAIDVALICKALDDANRLEIVQMLSDGEKCGCKLLERFEITQPTLSHHMKILVSLNQSFVAKIRSISISSPCHFYFVLYCFIGFSCPCICPYQSSQTLVGQYNTSRPPERRTTLVLISIS